MVVGDDTGAEAAPGNGQPEPSMPSLDLPPATRKNAEHDVSQSGLVEKSNPPDIRVQGLPQGNPLTQSRDDDDEEDDEKIPGTVTEDVEKWLKKELSVIHERWLHGDSGNEEHQHQQDDQLDVLSR